ncbi:MAG TPA: winged helix-turn-helix domain-containing protein [Candidatus Bilamarchaeaceae archaeon]|nr:winged helix-turn-helix domain-containing protein [Candidatus Bilamarchaeaceae archaeon]
MGSLVDRSDNVLWHLMAGTKGGPNRLQILYMLSVRPYNANQLSKETGLDYKTIKHHLEILVKNGLILVSREKKYGELYHLTEFSKEKVKLFEKIWEKLEK